MISSGGQNEVYFLLRDQSGFVLSLICSENADSRKYVFHQNEVTNKLFGDLNHTKLQLKEN